tara:strand:+ start:771 stop:1244 length:474 start_codon:yes stop_codon:yes gene_type:complete
MKVFNIFVYLFFLSIFQIADAIEAGKWTFVDEDQYCYIGSLPISTDLPKEKKRGDTYILVYRMIGQKETVVQIEAGYNYNLEKDIFISIDNNKYDFYSVPDVPNSAWTDHDDKVIPAMKKGLELIVTGESAPGTITNDTYTLKGFTAAFNKLNSECK